MESLEVLSPVAKVVEHSVKPAARLRDLGEATIGLYWNMKAGGDAALDRTEQLLRARFPGARFKRYTGSVGWLMRHCTAEDADRIASETKLARPVTGGEDDLNAALPERFFLLRPSLSRGRTGRRSPSQERQAPGTGIRTIN